MHTPIPTPFDILEPPPGPLIPTPTAWGILSMLVLTAILTFWISRRRHRPASVQRRVSILVDDIVRFSSQADSIEALQRVNKLAQRVLSAYLPFDPSALSPADLRTSATSLAKSSSLSEQSSAAILSRIAYTDELTYAPSAKPEEIKESAIQLAEAISQHVRRHRLS